MSPLQLSRIWEVFANLRSTPSEAADALARNCRVEVSEEEAARQLDAAKERNTLRLVTVRPDGGLRSNWRARVF